MPLAASVVLSTVRRLSGRIFAPDESRRSCTFLWIAVTSNEFRGMTFSLLLTVCKKKKVRREVSGDRRNRDTIKAADDGFLLISLFYDDLYMRVLTSEGLYG